MIFGLLRKEKRTITTPSELLERIASSYDAVSGISVTPETAVRHGYVFACVRVLAESIGQLPLHLYRETDKTKDKAREHPLYALIHDSPNDFQTAQEFWEMCVAHVALRGNFYALINRVGGRVAELLPLQPTEVEPKQQANWTVVYEVRLADGGKKTYAATDIFHVRGLSFDGITGVSPLTFAREQVGLSMATERHAAKFFSNGAQPLGVLQSDAEEPLDEAVYKRMKESWESRHQGGENAHKVAILEGGLKWASTGMSNEDAQMLESRKMSRTEICGLFRVPPTMIADLERATFSNSEQQNRQFVDYSLMPYLTRIESRIKLQLLAERQRASHFAKFNLGALLRGDMATRADFYTRQLQNGAMSPNEIRELEDMNPREGGDIFLTPLNMLVDGKLPEGAEPKPSPEEP
jgi:HK97 family phage portal protein